MTWGGRDRRVRGTCWTDTMSEYMLQLRGETTSQKELNGWTSNMAQFIRVPVAKSEVLSTILEMHMVEGED